jgi:phage repressor protein C with HTH and peptisase S24 domain
MSLAENLQNEMDKKGWSQYRLAKESDVPQGTISRILSGSNPRSGTIESIAKALGVSVDAIVSTGYQEASTPKSNAEIIGGVDGWDDSTPLGSDDVELPYHSDVFFAAGNGHQAEEFPTDKKLRFSKITLKKAGVDINNALCVKTNGTSMEPMLPDGSVVGVDTSRTNIVDGKVYAIRHNDELRIKQLYKAPGGGIRLRSYNQNEFPDEHYSAEDAANISVIGYVFWYSALI